MSKYFVFHVTSDKSCCELMEFNDLFEARVAYLESSLYEDTVRIIEGNELEVWFREKEEKRI